MEQPIAIIGATGALGAGLAARWERAGVEVISGGYEVADGVPVVSPKAIS